MRSVRGECPLVSGLIVSTAVAVFAFPPQAPDLDTANTSYVERRDLPIRKGVPRFTRLTNAFSKKAGEPVHVAVALLSVYNLVCATPRNRA